MKMVTRLVMVVAMVGALGATQVERAAAATPPCKKEEKNVGSAQKKFDKAAEALEKWLDRIQVKVENYLGLKQNAVIQYDVARATKNQCDGDDFMDGLLSIVIGGKKFKSIFACRGFYQKKMAQFDARAKGYDKKIAAFERSAGKKSARLEDNKEESLETLDKAKAALAACTGGSGGPTPTPTPSA